MRKIQKLTVSDLSDEDAKHYNKALKAARDELKKGKKRKIWSVYKATRYNEIPFRDKIKTYLGKLQTFKETVLDAYTERRLIVFSPEAEIEHVIPKSINGSINFKHLTNLSNMVLSLGLSNRSKSNTLIKKLNPLKDDFDFTKLAYYEDFQKFHRFTPNPKLSAQETEEVEHDLKLLEINHPEIQKYRYAAIHYNESKSEFPTARKMLNTKP